MRSIKQSNSVAGLIALAAAYIYSQFFRAFLPVLTPELVEQIDITQSDLSNAAAVWFVVFALMQFPVGIMLDRIGPRRTVAYLFGSACTAGVLLFAVSSQAWMIIVAMGLIGAGCAPVLMGSLFIITRTFAAKQFALLTSCVVAFGNLGNLASSAPLAKASELFGWRAVMIVIAITTVLLALLVLFKVQDFEQEPSESKGFAGFIELLKIKALWPILVIGFVVYAPVANMRGLWAGPFLANTYDASSFMIGKITLAMGVAMIIGSLVYGPLDKTLNTRKWVIYIGNLFVLLALVVLALNPASSLQQAGIIFVVVGFFGTSFGVLVAHGKHFIPKELTGRGVTLLNFTTIFGAGVMQYLTGAIAKTNQNPTSIVAYQSVFWTYAVILGLALLVYLFSKDAKPNE